MSSAPDAADLRRRVAERSRRFLERDLALPADGRAATDDPHLPVLEFAHTPHFGHLGFFRMLVHAVAAARASGSILLLVFNDHVRANALPTIRHIPMTRGGEKLDHPPSLGIAKADRARPLCYVPAPSPAALAKARACLESALLFERASRPGGPSKGRLLSRTAGLFDILTECAAEAGNYAHWAIRSLLVFLQGSPLAGTPVWVLRGADLVDVMPEPFARALPLRAELARLQNRAHHRRDADWPEWSRPKPAGDDYFPAWILCDRCRDATDTVSVHDDRLEIRCRSHQWAHRLGDPPRGFRISPKVVLRQPLADLLGLAGRVCGNRLGYWELADEVAPMLTGRAATPRRPVTGLAQFESALWPVSGTPSLLRVLAEMTPGDLVSQLLAPPHEDITVNALTASE